MPRRRDLGWLILPIGLAGGAVAYLLVSNLLQTVTWIIANQAADTNSYWDAAIRMRTGEPLYQPGMDPDAYNLYRYAPWFAALWIPLTLLPREPVFVLWAIAMTACALLAVLPLVRYGTPAAFLLVAMLGGYLLWTGVRGNIQPLVVVVLARTIDHRTGPIWVGVAASLKAFPIGFALVWIGRGEWRKAIIALACALILTLPSLVFNWRDYTFAAGARPPLIPIPVLQVALVLLSACITLRLAGTRYRWVGAALTIALAAPRFIEYNLSYFLVGIAPSLPHDEGST